MAKNMKSWPTTVAFVWLFGLTWLAYYGSLEGPFHFDDQVFILDNQILPNFAEIIRSLARPFSSGRALSLLTLHLNYVVHGFAVQGYHLVNTCIHAFNTFLVFFLILRLLPVQLELISQSAITKTPYFPLWWIACSGASLFAVHPLMSASVLYITQRSGLLATMFYLLAFLSYLQLRSHLSHSTKRWWWFGTTLLCFWLAFKCKEAVLAALLIPLWYEGIIRVPNPERQRNFLKWVALWLVIFGAVMGIYLNNASHLFEDSAFIGFGSKHLWGMWPHWQTMLRVLIHYWKLLILPLPQWMSVDHGFSISYAFFDVWALFSFAVHLVILGLAYWAAKRRNILLSLGVGWFYISLAPYMIVPERDVFVEYKTYLPAAGGILIVASLLCWLFKNPTVRLLVTQQSDREASYQNSSRTRVYPTSLKVFVIILVGLGIIGTWKRVEVHQDLLSLWKDAIQTSPYKSRVLYNLGYAYAQEKHYTAAILYAQKSLQMNRASVHSQISLARFYVRNQLPEQSIVEYQELLSLEKQYPYWDWGEIGFQAYYELGQLYTQLKRWQDALPLLLEAMQRKPEDTGVHEVLGKVNIHLGQQAEAFQHFQYAVEKNPASPAAHFYLGALWLQANQPRQALPHLLMTIQLAPQEPDNYNNLGIAHQILGNRSAAIQAFQKALQLQPNHHNAGRNLKALQASMESKPE